MFRELDEIAKVIAHNTTCRVFSAGIWDRYVYPYRLVNVDSIRPSIRDSAYELYLDSKYEDKSVTNQQVLDTAEEYNVDAVFPVDFPGEPHRTHKSFQQFISLYESHPWSGRVFVILQPPHLDHYREYTKDYQEFSHLALGGLQSLSTEKQIQAVRDVRAEVGPHKHLHLLGVGSSPEMVKFLRSEQLANSIDLSTPENGIKSGSVPDRTWDQKSIESPTGEKSTTIRALYAKTILYQLNYMLSPLADDDQIPVDEGDLYPDSKQATFETIAQLSEAVS